MTNTMQKAKGSQTYPTTLAPSLLEPIERSAQRAQLGLAGDNLPFAGLDVWNAYEFTWLNGRGKPEVAIARIGVMADSPRLIESKSMKLYLGSYSGTKFEQTNDLVSSLEADLSKAAQTPVSVALLSPTQVCEEGLGNFPGTCLDDQDLTITEYQYNPNLLQLEGKQAVSESLPFPERSRRERERQLEGKQAVSESLPFPERSRRERERQLEGKQAVSESLYTRLFKSLCPLTGQPDFADILIQYQGAAISHAALLKYLVSYREHADFAEQVTERIFMDLQTHCAPERLTVTARYTRRGGIDINAHRGNDNSPPLETRLGRQ